MLGKTEEVAACGEDASISNAIQSTLVCVPSACAPACRFLIQNGDRSCEFRPCWFSPVLNRFTFVDPFAAGIKARKRFLTRLLSKEASTAPTSAVMEADARLTAEWWQH